MYLQTKLNNGDTNLRQILIYANIQQLTQKDIRVQLNTKVINPRNMLNANTNAAELNVDRYNIRNATVVSR